MLTCVTREDKENSESDSTESEELIGTVFVTDEKSTPGTKEMIFHQRPHDLKYRPS